MPLVPAPPWPACARSTATTSRSPARPTRQPAVPGCTVRAPGTDQRTLPSTGSRLTSSPPRSARNTPPAARTRLTRAVHSGVSENPGGGPTGRRLGRRVPGRYGTCRRPRGRPRTCINPRAGRRPPRGGVGSAARCRYRRSQCRGRHRGSRLSTHGCLPAHSRPSRLRQPPSAQCRSAPTDKRVSWPQLASDATHRLRPFAARPDGAPSAPHGVRRPPAGASRAERPDPGGGGAGGADGQIVLRGA